eukprot:jgi/Mesvir1/15720/Mv03299-RA.1
MCQLNGSRAPCERNVRQERCLNHDFRSRRERRLTRGRLSAVNSIAQCRLPWLSIALKSFAYGPFVKRNVQPERAYTISYAPYMTGSDVAYLHKELCIRILLMNCMCCPRQDGMYWPASLTDIGCASEDLPHHPCWKVADVRPHAAPCHSREQEMSAGAPTNISQELTLEQVMAVPGIGAQVMSFLPIPNRVRLRRTCRTFLAAADESFLTLTEIFADNVTENVYRPDTNGLIWLMDKSPNVLPGTLVSECDWVRGRDGCRFNHARADVPWSGVPGCIRMHQNVGDAGNAVAKSFPGLHRLLMTQCDAVGDASLIALSERCRQLEVVFADRTRASGAGVIVIARNCPRLAEGPPEHLGMFQGRVSDVGMKRLAAGRPHLTRLDADCLHVIGDEGVCALAERCTGMLRYLDLTWVEVTEEGISVVGWNCPQLERLYLIGGRQVTDMGLVQVAKYCRKLRHLSIRDCYLMEDEGICCVAQHCPGLQVLDADLVRVCTKLDELDLTPARGVTDEHLSAIRQLHCTQQRVFAAGQHRFSEGALLRLLEERGSQLRVLNLGEGRTTDRVVSAVAALCPNLQVLLVHGCPAVTAESVTLVMQRCKALWLLNVEGSSVPGATAEMLNSRKCKVQWSPQDTE